MSKPPPVSVLIGPARSGKAALVRRRYLDLISESAPDRVLMLVPTRQRQAATLDLLLRESARRVLWQPCVRTFPRYAEELLRQLATPAQRVTPTQRHALLAEAFQDCRRAGKVRYFLSLVDHPGLLDSLAEFIHRLKSHEVRPETFAKAVSRQSAGLREMAAVYAHYQSLLTDHDLYDDAGLFWQARDAISQTPPEFAWPDHVLVDGFQDFAAPQLDILTSLHNHGARVLITLPCRRDRPEVFGPTLRTLESIEAAFEGAVDVRESPPPKGRPTTTPAHLEKTLFDDGARGMAPAPPEAISFIQAAGRTREVEALARRIKRLLQDKPDRSPGDVAVILRSEEPYAALVSEVFRRYGLPLTDVPGQPLDCLPLAAWLLTLLRLPVDNFRYRDLAAVLRSPYFPRERFGASQADLEAADRLLHQLGVFEGADNHLAALEQYVADTEARRRYTESDAEWVPPSEADAAPRVAAMLRALFDRLSPLGVPATRRQHVAVVRALLDELDLQPIVAGGDPGSLDLVARDLAWLERVGSLLDEMAALTEWTTEHQMPSGQFVADFEQALRSAPALGPPAPLGRGVRILDVRSSRALSFPIVVMPGLNDGQWPLPRRAHMLETPENRDPLAAAGLPVADRDDQLAEERFLFYMAATRASERLIVSRPATDDEGRPQLASPFWDLLLRLTTADADGPEIERVSVRDTDLPLEEAACLEEVRRCVFARLATADRSAADAVAGLAAVDPAATPMLASVAVQRERESERPFGQFDGVLANRTTLTDLEADYPGRHVFSITRLQDYLWCPFRFFAVTVLGLRAWEVPQESFLEAEVGELYHEILRDFYLGRTRDAVNGTRLTSVDIDTLRSEMIEAADRVFRNHGATGQGGMSALWRIQKDEVTGRLLDYLAAEIDRCTALPLTAEPRLFEWSFGSDRQRDDDARSTHEPLTIDSDNGAIRVRGRIDRVDLLLDRQTPKALVVIDYKSGARPGATAGSIAEGKDLQLPLYLLAVGQRLADRLKARPAQGIYYTLRDLKAIVAMDALGTGKKADVFEKALGAAQASVRDVVEGVRAGRFPAVPSGDCPPWCEYRAVCRTARWRVELKLAEIDGEPDE